jgi:hypothetical protein
MPVSGRRIWRTMVDPGTSPTASYTSSPAQRLLSVLAPMCSAERRVDNASGSDLMLLRVDLGVAGRRAGLPGG